MASAFLKETALGRTDLWKIDPRQLIVDPEFNIREDYGDMAELIDSVIQRGVIEPLLCERVGEKVIIRRGHRRHRAALTAIERGHDVPFVLVKLTTSEHTDLDDTLDFITSNSGKPLTLLEEARVFERLRDRHELPLKEIAQRTSKSITHVKNCFALLDAPAPVLKHVGKGRIAASLVIDLIHETKGDEAALAARVDEAIQHATDRGKDKATRKDVPEAPAATPPAEDPSAESGDDRSEKKSTGTIPFQDVRSEASPRERGLSRDTTKNMEKFNKMLEGLDTKRDQTVKPLHELAEAIYAALDGTTDFKNVRNLILGNA